MNEHLIILSILGIGIFVMSWLPAISDRMKISYAVLLMFLGIILNWLPLPLPWPDPLWPDKWIMPISEAIVIISLMGAGLKIGQHYQLKDWKIPFRLIFITMPLCMLSVYFIGNTFFALSVPGAVLLAAALAPTDPVLASEVQIEDPEENRKQPVKFTLTGEAGINDGLAFPFTYMAVLMADQKFSIGSWFLDKFMLKIFLGVVVGVVLGKFAGWLIETLPRKVTIRNPKGFIGLGITFMTYGLAELAHGYGFIAVFVAALFIRHEEEVEGSLKVKMHDFIDETEKLLLVIWLFVFGGAASNGLLGIAGMKGLLFALVFILIVRPLAGRISLLGTSGAPFKKWVVSFCGIRGIGSIFYISWAFIQTDNFQEKELIYSLAAMVIFVSIIIHGATASRLVERL